MKHTKPKRWYINEDPAGRGSDWPVPLSYGKGDVTPFWVWDDRKLAEKTCQALNQLKIKPSHD